MLPHMNRWVTYKGGSKRFLTCQSHTQMGMRTYCTIEDIRQRKNAHTERAANGKATTREKDEQGRQLNSLAVAASFLQFSHVQHSVICFVNEPCDTPVCPDASLTNLLCNGYWRRITRGRIHNTRTTGKMFSEDVFSLYRLKFRKMWLTGKCESVRTLAMLLGFINTKYKITILCYSKDSWWRSYF